MKIIDCAKCGIEFMITDSFHDSMRYLGPKGSFYCPAGHPQHFHTANQNWTWLAKRRIDSAGAQSALHSGPQCGKTRRRR